MPLVDLFGYQLDAVDRMKNGCILCGGVGSGKSITSLAYFYLQNGGSSDSIRGGEFKLMPKPCDLYIITTARKRDTFEWDQELVHFMLSTHEESNAHKNKVVVDSWNNVAKYQEARDSFFIFDEQRVVGSGKWVRAFLKIARCNHWILLSATPGDTWQDYIPVFIANGFYKNRSQFVDNHIVYRYGAKFPQVDRYLDTGHLAALRNKILVDMDFKRETTQHHADIYCDYDVITYKTMQRERWDIWKNEPFINAGAMCYGLRRIVNENESRATKVLEIQEKHPRVIVFYNFDYERELLLSLEYLPGTEVAEWNGHKHQPIPTSGSWVYLVQYTAGCEGWNCITTDTIIFYSQNYSYKVMVQAAGRTDRLNTPYSDLYYYHLKSRSSIDYAIAKAIREKKTFNEKRFTGW